MKSIFGKIYETNSLYILAILLFAVFCYMGHAPVIVWDMAWYMSRALNILYGYGYSGTDQTFKAEGMARGPVFPMMLAIGLWFDKSAAAAFWAVRFFALLTPLLIYFFCCVFLRDEQGKQAYYARGAGLIAALAYMGSWAVNNASMRHIDAVWPALVLLSLIILFHLFYNVRGRASQIFYVLLAGSLLGIAYLTKEAAILFLPLPFAAWLLIPKLRNKQVFILSLTVTLVASGWIFMWLAYVYSLTGHVPFLGIVGNWVLPFFVEKTQEAEAISYHSIWIDIQRWWSAFWLIFWGQRTSLLQVIPVGILFPVAGLLLFALAIRKEPQFRFLLACIVVYFPLAMFNAENGWRIGNYLPFYLFSFIIVGVAIAVILKNLSNERLFFFGTWVVAVCLFFAGFYPNSQGRSNLDFLSGGLWAQSMGAKDRNIRGYDYLSPANHRIFTTYFGNHKNTENGVRLNIATDHPAQSNALYFMLDTKHNSYFIDASLCFQRGIAGEGYRGEYSPADKLLFFDVKLQNMPPFPIITLFEEHFLAQIEQQSIDYIAYYNNHIGLDEYMAAHPAFTKLSQQATPPRSLWKIDPTLLRQTPVDFITRIEPRARGNLERLMQQNDPKIEMMFTGMQACHGVQFNQEWFDSWYRQAL